jgi:tRNA nucleotidyltransferase (CCA-adding enzyme)
MDAATLWARVPALWRERLRRLGAHAGDRPAAVVGGWVRDLILGRASKDWDVVMEGDTGPAVRALAAAEGARLKSHPAFGTHTLTYPDGTSLDVATARTETYPAPGALPRVRPAGLAEDARRRDFTVNALYLKLPVDTGPLWDPLGGLADIGRGWIRALHAASFVDDPTRVYRAARYAGRFGWSVEEATRQWIDQARVHDRAATLSPVRRRNELFHLLREKDPAPALRLLWDWGFWKYWDPAWEMPDQWPDAAADPLPERLAALLSTRPGDAAGWLKRHDAPTALQREVQTLMKGKR